MDHEKTLITPMNEKKSILIATGELSGEIYAANLVPALLAKYPNLKIYAMGSTILKKSGAEIVVDTQNLSLIGALEVLTKFLKIYRAFSTMGQVIREKKPDLVILVDYPGFNLRLAKVAKEAGSKVLYFIGPKVWAWKPKRIETIKKYVTMMAVIFPFEVNLYEGYGIPVKFVGNPLLTLMPKSQINDFPASNKVITIGLFPGSRSNEIKRLLPTLLKTAEILKNHYPSMQFILAQADSIGNQELQRHIQNSSVPVQVIAGHSYEVMQKSDIVISASGTATLEIALMETPLVIIYKISWLEYQIAKWLIKIPHVGLCNILAGKSVAPELLQHSANPKNIAREVEKIIADDTYRMEMVKEFKKIKASLATDVQIDLISIINELI